MSKLCCVCKKELKKGDQVVVTGWMIRHERCSTADLTCVFCEKSEGQDPLIVKNGYCYHETCMTLAAEGLKAAILSDFPPDIAESITEEGAEWDQEREFTREEIHTGVYPKKRCCRPISKYVAECRKLGYKVKYRPPSEMDVVEGRAKVRGRTSMLSLVYYARDVAQSENQFEMATLKSRGGRNGEVVPSSIARFSSVSEALVETMRRLGPGEEKVLCGTN